MKRMRGRAFKAARPNEVDDISATVDPATVSKRGISVVITVPPQSREPALFGFMAGEFTVAGDTESPVVPLKVWRNLQK